MTVIVWDGKYLVGDRKVTNSRSDIVRIGTHTASKIHTFKNPLKFGGVDLLAIGVAGSMQQIYNYLDAVFKKSDVTNHTDRPDFRAATQNYINCNVNPLDFAVLFLTHNPDATTGNGLGTMTLTYDHKQRKNKLQVTSPKFISIGSGSAIAKSFKRVMPDADAIDLVIYASVFDQYVGKGMEVLEPEVSPDIRVFESVQHDRLVDLGKALSVCMVNHHEQIKQHA